jgi:ABC-type multidrug transport system ATPase subunit
MREPSFDLCSDLAAVSSPQLWIQSGAQFGHRGGFWRNQTTRILVELPAAVFLESGLHLFVAPNGSGKTTLLRTLAGLHPALKGQVRLAGMIHYVSDQMQLDGELSSRRLFKNWFGEEALSYCYGLVDKLGLDVACEIGKLSRGNRQKVLLVMAETLAAVSGPSLLFLDEPLAGMDAETREVIAEFWASTKGAVLRLVVLHELESVEKADSLFTISHGELRHTYEKKGSWFETCRELRAQ